MLIKVVTPFDKKLGRGAKEVLVHFRVAKRAKETKGAYRGN